MSRFCVFVVDSLFCFVQAASQLAMSLSVNSSIQSLGMRKNPIGNGNNLTRSQTRTHQPQPVHTYRQTTYPAASCSVCRTAQICSVSRAMPC